MPAGDGGEERVGVGVHGAPQRTPVAAAHGRDGEREVTHVEEVQRYEPRDDAVHHHEEGAEVVAVP